MSARRERPDVWKQKLEREHRATNLTPTQWSLIEAARSRLGGDGDTSIKALAADLRIGTSTVKSHMNSILRILKMSGGGHSMSAIIAAADKLRNPEE